MNARNPVSSPTMQFNGTGFTRRIRVMTVSEAIRKSVAITVAAVVLLCPGNASAFHRTEVRAGEIVPPATLSSDCTLQYYNICSGWLWIYNDQEHALWGTVFNPGDCPGVCATGGAVTEVSLYSRCETPPGILDGIRILSVDAIGCPTALLYQSGPIDLAHCASGDRWTTLPIPFVHVGGQPFVVQVEWGAASSLRLASDNALRNEWCAIGIWEGCSEGHHCDEWIVPVERSFIYVTDIDLDGTLDDMCANYGVPFPLWGWYGDAFPNNLLMSVAMDCQSPTATALSTWGRVKHLFE